MDEPVEITDYESAEAWLQTQDHQTQVWFASRAALRCLPNLAEYPDALLSGLRATLIAAAASRSSASQMHIFEKTASSAHSAADHHGTYDQSAHERAAVSAAAAAASVAQQPSQLRTKAVSAVGSAAGSLAEAAVSSDSDDPSFSREENEQRDAARALIYRAASFDANLPLNWKPLWGENKKPHVLRSIRGASRNCEADWSFWFEWYEGILNGTPMDWDLIFKIATEISEKDWDSGQSVVGPRIAKIRAAYDVQSLANEVAESAYFTQPGNPGIGHNQPPSLIDDDLREQAPETLIWVAASSLREEAASTKPDTAPVRKAVGILVAALQASGLWVAQKLDKAITDAAGAFGKAFGGAAGVSCLAYVTGNSDKIMQLVDRVLSWLPLVG